MADVDDVLERLVIDDAFRAQLATDPDAALAGYDLTDDDRTLLTSQVRTDAGQAGAVEARASKAGLFGMLGGLDEIADAITDAPEATTDQYDYPGDYAIRGDDPVAGGYPIKVPLPLLDESTGSNDPAATPMLAEGHEAAHVVQQDAPSGSGDAAVLEDIEIEKEMDSATTTAAEHAAPTLAGGTDTDYDPWPAKWFVPELDSDTAAPSGTDGEWIADVERPGPDPAGDAGEQVYLKVELENVQAPSAEPTDLAAATSDPVEEQPNESDLDFVQQRADAEAGSGVAIEKVEIVHESIQRLPAEPPDDSNWIELNSVTQTVTEAIDGAPPGPEDLAADAAPEPVMGFMHMAAGTQDAAPEQPPTPGGVGHDDDWGGGEAESSQVAATSDADAAAGDTMEVENVSFAYKQIDLDAPGDSGAAETLADPQTTAAGAQAGGMNEVSMEDTAGTESATEPPPDAAADEATRPATDA